MFLAMPGKANYSHIPIKVLQFSFLSANPTIPINKSKDPERFMAFYAVMTQTKLHTISTENQEHYFLIEPNNRRKQPITLVATEPSRSETNRTPESQHLTYL